MKQITVATAVFVALIVAGCEDASNILNGPGTEGLTETHLSKTAYRVTTFSANFVEPEGRNAFTSVTGTVSYTMSIFTLDPIPPAPQAMAVIDLTIHAILTDVWTGMIVGEVDGSTHAEVALRENDASDTESSFERTYRITGRPPWVVLVVRYEVTRAGIEVSRVYLASRSREAAASTNE